MKTEENKPTFKRVLAYVVDFIIVTMIASLFANIEVINPNLEKYNTVYQDYYNYIYSLSDTTELLSNSEILTNFTYDIAYYSVVTTLITLVITILYFVVFQYINNGKTIGKALFKLKVVDNNDKKPSIIQFLLRSLIVNSVFTTLLGSIIIVYMSKDNYLSYSTYVEYLEMILLFLSFGMILIRKDGRGLHDLFGKTKVISTESNIKYVIKEKTIDLKENKIDDSVAEEKSKKIIRKKKSKNEDSDSK